MLTASAVAYELLRWVGAAYLVWLGLSMLWSTRRARREPVPVTVVEAPAHSDRGAFAAGWRRGVATNLLNPKMGAFYVALLPQFVPDGASPFSFGVLLACVHIALGVVWSTVLVLVARRLRGVLQRPTAQRLMDRITGTVIAGFGVRLAVSSR